MKTGFFIILFGLYSFTGFAQTKGIFDGSSLKPISLEQALNQVKPGSVVIIGENHGFLEHRNQHLEILKTLRRLGHRVSVGMEFFTFTDQSWVDQYRLGRLPEEDFLQQIKWGSFSFDYYRDQTLFPQASDGGKTWALNAPRTLTSKVAQQGFESLTSEERALLPPNFAAGRASYKKRFLEMMPHLPDQAVGERYFLAQSIWDDTMAWRAVEFMKAYPEQTLVIIVGDFHVQYGGGLPDRLHARGPHLDLWTVSQVNTADLTPEDIQAEISPSPVEGPRADLLWLAPL